MAWLHTVVEVAASICVFTLLYHAYCNHIFTECWLHGYLHTGTAHPTVLQQHMMQVVCSNVTVVRQCTEQHDKGP